MTETRAVPGVEYDSDVVGRRIVAALIDVVAMVVLFFVMALVFGGIDTDDGFSVELNDGPAVLYGALNLAYYIIFEALTASTPGKMIMGLRVVKIDGTYGWGSSLVRNLLRIVDALPFLYLVGLITIAVTKRNQRLGDLAARTLVVRDTPR